MAQLTANDLKTRGIAAIEELLRDQPEVTISVRGQPRFVAMDLARYHYMRECELDAALAQSQADIAAGRFVVQSAREHLGTLEAMLDADGRTLSVGGAASVGRAASASGATRVKASARGRVSPVSPQRKEPSGTHSARAQRRRPGA